MRRPSLLLFEKLGLLETYKPAGVDALKQAFRDSNAPYTWTGMDAYLGVICFNTAEAAKDNIATPTSWKDLHQPRTQGQTRDAASGVVRHRLSHGRAPGCRCMGEAEGWKFMDALHENIARLYAFRLGALRAGGQG